MGGRSWLSVPLAAALLRIGTASALRHGGTPLMFVSENSANEVALDIGGLRFYDDDGRMHDVVLNGEPKSGTTWLEYVVKEILTTACTDETTCHLTHNERTVTTETAAAMLTYSLDEKHIIPGVGHINKFDFNNPPALTDKEIRMRARETLRNSSTGKQWLVVFRDPRSVTLSSCFHMYKNCPDPAGFSMKRIDVLTKWIDLRYRFFKELQKQAEPKRVMLLFYEDIREDEVGYINKIGGFFGVSLTEAQVAKVQETTTLSAMKDMGKRVPQGGAASGKVREGATCGYRSELPEDAGKRVTQKMRRLLGKELKQKWTC